MEASDREDNHGRDRDRQEDQDRSAYARTVSGMSRRA
jgi:hypothetical protein